MLKHEPIADAVVDNNWNINFAGLRADESRARDLAVKRDGPLYFANIWNLYRVNPIIFWTDDMVWEYTRKNNIPYVSIYDMMIMEKSSINQELVAGVVCSGLSTDILNG